MLSKQQLVNVVKMQPVLQCFCLRLHFSMFNYSTRFSSALHRAESVEIIFKNKTLMAGVRQLIHDTCTRLPAQ